MTVIFFVCVTLFFPKCTCMHFIAYLVFPCQLPEIVALKWLPSHVFYYIRDKTAIHLHSWKGRNIYKVEGAPV